MLFETVREAQKGSEEAKLELVERFQPTIRANAWKLNREDGKEEMTLAFLEILESMNLESVGAGRVAFSSRISKTPCVMPTVTR